MVRWDFEDFEDQVVSLLYDCSIMDVIQTYIGFQIEIKILGKILKKIELCQT